PRGAPGRRGPRDSDPVPGGVERPRYEASWPGCPVRAREGGATPRAYGYIAAGKQAHACTTGAMMADAATLTATDVSVRFGGVMALSDVSRAARPGEVLGLIGPNGAGKTTLFDALSGIPAPTSGRILYEDEDITKRSP